MSDGSSGTDRLANVEQASDSEREGQAIANRGGLFFVFEGVEGAGKSTQVRLLASWCQAAGIAAEVTREPGGTALGEQIRRLLLDGGDVPPRSELLLYLAARAALVDSVIRPALAAGHVVLADRYELSTLAYQGFGRDLALDRVRALNAFATGGLQPDLTFLLELDPGAGLARREAASAGRDRIEREADAFHARVAAAYGRLAADEATVVRIDADADPARVHEAVLSVLQERFPETFANRQG